MADEAIYIISNARVNWDPILSGQRELYSALERVAKQNELLFFNFAHLRHDILEMRWVNPPIRPSVAFINLFVSGHDILEQIIRIRRSLPSVVFVLYGDAAEYKRCLSEIPPEWAEWLECFYLLPKQFDNFEPSLREILDVATATALRRKAEIRFFSCFISYSHKDKEFAQWLHEQLRGFGVQCWLDEKQLRAGDRIHTRIQEAIDQWDKILLCASKNSLTSWWVDNEINAAIAKEQQLWKERGKETLALIPLNLDGFLFSDEWKSGWKHQITSRLAPDFTDWLPEESHFFYNMYNEKGLGSIYKALRADELLNEAPPVPLL